jgi:hypothetical protein
MAFGRPCCLTGPVFIKELLPLLYCFAQDTIVAAATVMPLEPLDHVTLDTPTLHWNQEPLSASQHDGQKHSN